jgi:hypothetical protein
MLQFTFARLHQLLSGFGGDERGEVTEKVIIVAIFAGLAIAAGAVIVARVMARAEGIVLE